MRAGLGSVDRRHGYRVVAGVAIEFVSLAGSRARPRAGRARAVWQAGFARYDRRDHAALPFALNANCRWLSALFWQHEVCLRFVVNEQDATALLVAAVFANLRESSDWAIRILSPVDLSSRLVCVFAVLVQKKHAGRVFLDRARSRCVSRGLRPSVACDRR